MEMSVIVAKLSVSVFAAKLSRDQAGSFHSGLRISSYSVSLS